MILWLGVIVFVLVEGLLIWTMIKYRSRPGQSEPEHVHGNTTLEISWTVIPALILLAVIIAAFYLLIKFTGGSGVRTEGRTLVDKPSEEENPPPSLPLS